MLGNILNSHVKPSKFKYIDSSMFGSTGRYWELHGAVYLKVSAVGQQYVNVL
jgi:hypothetical protein